jgi:hypothetical protein
MTNNDTLLSDIDTCLKQDLGLSVRETLTKVREVLASQATRVYDTKVDERKANKPWWHALATAADAVANSADVWEGFAMQDAKTCIDAYYAALSATPAVDEVTTGAVYQYKVRDLSGWHDCDSEAFERMTDNHRDHIETRVLFGRPPHPTPKAQESDPKVCICTPENALDCIYPDCQKGESLKFAKYEAFDMARKIVDEDMKKFRETSGVKSSSQENASAPVAASTEPSAGEALTNHERIELYELRAMSENLSDRAGQPVAEVIRHNAPHIEPACFKWLGDNAKTIPHGTKLYAAPAKVDCGGTKPATNAQGMTCRTCGYTSDEPCPECLRGSFI